MVKKILRDWLEIAIPKFHEKMKKKFDGEWYPPSREFFDAYNIENGIVMVDYEEDHPGEFSIIYGHIGRSLKMKEIHRNVSDKFKLYTTSTINKFLRKKYGTTRPSRALTDLVLLIYCERVDPVC